VEVGVSKIGCAEFGSCNVFRVVWVWNWLHVWCVVDGSIDMGMAGGRRLCFSIIPGADS
jgi:hypothetical protein